MKLTELSPRLSAPGGRYQTLTFLCPKCQRHELAIDIWNGSAGDVKLPVEVFPGQTVEMTKRLWHATQGPHRDWDTLTVQPSINREGIPGEPCGGWHGFITNGEIT